MNPLYRTSNMEYSPKWLINNDTTIENYKLPTFKEINESQKKIKTLELKIKSKFTKKKNEDLKNENSENLDVEDLKLKNNKNAINSKKCNFNFEKYKIEKSLMNSNNPLYMTSNMDYGRLNPSKHEVHNRWFPKSNEFSNGLKGKLYRNNGLNTVVDKNRVLDLLDIN